MNNLIEILKNAPQGLELYSKSEGTVIFEGIEEEQIIKTNKAQYDKYGRKIRPVGSNECDLFPSESHLTWDNFWKDLFRVGYILYSDKYHEAYIFMGEDTEENYWFKQSNGQLLVSDLDNFRFATKDEILDYISNIKYTPMEKNRNINWEEFRIEGSLKLMQAAMSQRGWVGDEGALANYCIKSIDLLIDKLRK